MTEAFASTRSRQATGPFHVAAPRRGDRLSGALHVAYDHQSAMPDDFACLLAKLDAFELRPN